MTKPKQIVTPPPAARPGGEPNRYLAKFKTSLARRWSHTRMNELYDQVDLARFLWALEREAEALEILRSVTSVIATPYGRDGLPDYNIWSPVAAMNALEARICRLAGDIEAAAAPTARIMADAALAPNREFIAGEVTEAKVKLDEAFAETSAKWACHKLSRRTGSLVLLRELAVADHPYARWFDHQDVEELILTGRALLATRLSAAA
ncbi:MAG: hypothetical protein JWN52_7580 [Actinomycetia bacterium]|nr:hypothetical protein [Actinomycetes bacterium]